MSPVPQNMSIPSSRADKASSGNVIDATARQMVADLRVDFHDLRAENKKEMGELRAEQSLGFKQMMEKFDSQNESKMKSLSGRSAAIVSTGLGLIGVSFAFTTLITQPLREDASQTKGDLKELRLQQTEHVTAHIQAAVDTGKLLQSVDANRKEIVRTESVSDRLESQLHNTTSTVDKIQGEVEILKESVRDIDSQGPRKQPVRTVP